MTNPTHAPADMLDAKALEAAITAGDRFYETSADDAWRDHYVEAIRAYLAALPAGNEPVAVRPYRWLVECSNLPPELFADEGSADQWANSPGHFDSIVTPLYASPLTPAEGEAAGWCMLVDGDKSYHIPPAELSTLMAHGMLKMLPDGSYRLCEEEEMERDPGSAGVNNPHPRALLAVLRAMLASRSTPAEGGTAQPVQVGQKWRWLGRMETEFFTPGQCYTILSVHPGTDYTSVYITDNNGASSNGGQGHSWSFRPEAGSDNFLDYFELAASRSTPSGEKGNG